MSSSACPFCNKLFPVSELERHANDHLAEEENQRDLILAHQIAFASDSETNDVNYSEFFVDDTLGSGVTASTSENREGHIHEKISSLFCVQIRSTFHRVEGGLMSLLRRCLEFEGGNSVSIIADHVDHFQSLASEDAGWGCGWRNIQMLSSHLLKQRPEAKKVLFGGSGFVPDIPSLQRWLEIAWERGFDVSGSEDFDKRVYGSGKWIGTTECATLFRSFGVRARIVDFGYKDIDSYSKEKEGGKHYRGKRKTAVVSGPMDRFLLRHPQDPLGHGKSMPTDIHSLDVSGAAEKNKGAATDPGLLNRSTSSKAMGQQILMEWVWNYFSDKKVNNTENLRQTIVSEKTPLYFQHDGHSRTIVGIQVRQQSGAPKEYTLLILDPGQRTNALETSLRENFGWQKLIKRGVHTLKKPQYQLCYVDPGIADGKELEQLKTLDSIFFEF